MWITYVTRFLRDPYLLYVTTPKSAWNADKHACVRWVYMSDRHCHVWVRQSDRHTYTYIWYTYMIRITHVTILCNHLYIFTLIRRNGKLRPYWVHLRIWNTSVKPYSIFPLKLSCYLFVVKSGTKQFSLNLPIRRSYTKPWIDFAQVLYFLVSNVQYDSSSWEEIH